MNENRITLLAVIIAIFSTFASVSSCATGHHKKTVSEKHIGTPKNYSIYKPGQIDYGLLRKGQKAQYSSALDEY